MSRKVQAAPTFARDVVLLLVLLLATLAAYRPAWHGGILWDDDAHITRAELQGADGLRRIWTEPGATQQYYPLVHSAFWLEHRIWGDDTFGYHLVNIVLHALSAFLVALILRRLRVPLAWLAALFFALHPIEVESVAWITELKNALSGVFYLAAALAWLAFDTSRQRRFYALALGLFVLALLSKSVTATLPAALLVVVWWQRGRVDWRRDVRPLVPFFVAGIAGGVFTAWAERTLIGAHGATFAFTPVERCLVAGRAVWFYLAKLFWPANLTFIYPRWAVSQAIWWQYLFPIAALLLVGVAWRVRRQSRAPLAALLFFVGTLSPALGFLNVFPFRYSFVADHFQYLAGIGMIALACGGAAAAVRRYRLPANSALTAGLVVAIVLGVLTFRQSGDYADAQTLYRATLDRDPRSWLAHNNLGFLQLQEAPDEAEQHFRQALAAKPDYPEAHNNLGYVLQLKGRFEEAAREYQEALRLEPAYAEALNNLGSAFERMGRLADAVPQYERAVKLRPAFLPARVNLANALLEVGRVDEGVGQYKAVLRVMPELADAHRQMAAAFERAGRVDEAIAQYRELARLEPASAATHTNLANALYAKGRFDEAADQYRQALALSPDSAEAHNNLGATLERLGRMDEAVAEYQQTVRLRPDSDAARTNLTRARARLK